MAEERPVAHGDALERAACGGGRGGDAEAAAQRAVEVLHDRFAHYDWIGIYWVDGSGRELHLGPWTGPEATEHTVIRSGRDLRRGRGVGADRDRGRRERRSALPRCFTTTRSEIVVPIFDGADVIGEIDIDGSDLAAYDETDRPLPRGGRRPARPLRPDGIRAS